MKIIGKFKKIIFENISNNFIIAKFKLNNKKINNKNEVVIIKNNFENEITIIGKVKDINLFNEFEIEIEEKDYNYNFNEKQYKIISYKKLIISYKEAIIKFLSLIKGIGFVKGKKIVDAFNIQIDPFKKEFTIFFFKSIIKNYQILTIIIGKEKSEELFQIIKNEDQLIFNYHVEFIKNNLKNELFKKLFKKYEKHLFKICNDNPYILIDEDKVNLTVCDKIAMIFDHNIETSIARKKAYIFDIVYKYIFKTKSTFIPLKNVFNSLKNTFWNLNKEDYMKIIEILNNDNKLYVEKNWITLKWIEAVENNINIFTKKMLDKKMKADAEIKNNQILFDQDQKEAIKMAVNNGISIVSGPPGSGKTTIIKEIIKIYKENNLKFEIVCLSGKAVGNIEKKTGYRGKTIHRLLGYNSFEFEYGNNNKYLNLDCIIIDEMSMVDILLFHHLIKAIPNLKSIVLIGDNDQIPAIDPGNLFFDLIASKKIKVKYLKKIYRQDESSNIIKNAIAIIKGKKPIFNEKDCKLIKCNKIDIKKIINNIIEKSKDKNWQFLSPMKKRWNGTSEINTHIQKVLIKNENPIKCYEKNSEKIKKFFIKDKIIQIRNNYNYNVFNGEFGFIKSHNEMKNIIGCQFNDNTFEYSNKIWKFKNLEEIRNYFKKNKKISIKEFLLERKIIRLEDKKIGTIIDADEKDIVVQYEKNNIHTYQYYQLNKKIIIIGIAIKNTNEVEKFKNLEIFKKYLKENQTFTIKKFFLKREIVRLYDQKIGIIIDANEKEIFVQYQTIIHEKEKNDVVKYNYENINKEIIIDGISIEDQKINLNLEILLRNKFEKKNDFIQEDVQNKNIFEKNVELGYAITIHKAQGSEFDIVVLICFKDHYFMNSKKLLYTAMTRARKKLIIIGDVGYKNDAIDAILLKNDEIRKTKLGEKLALL